MKNHPKRLTRAESFLGVHFDFHAGEDCKEVGKNVTPKMVEEIIRQVRPDYLQCDCKGHPGIASYPTRVGTPAPGFVRDPLRIWRDVTARNGVGLYMHFSGVFDQAAIKRHPSWARIDENGKKDPNNTSVFGPYADKLLIPQLKELRDVYGVDGVWVDGECWATCQDYHPKVLEMFRKQTGLKTIPKKKGDPGFFELSEICREGFRQYLRHYVDELHRHDPEFQVCSNWAFTSLMPDPVTANVDFISGDYALNNSLNSARLEARCMALQGKPWDLMAWSFASRWDEKMWTTKTVPQLQQEAALVLALGGGFQAYFTQKRDGSVPLWTMKLMAETARFCRARQDACHKAQSVPQVALLLSSSDFHRKNSRVFSWWDGILEPLRGTLQSLLNSQNSVDILCEHHLEDRLDQYPILVVPEWDYITPKTKRQLVDYVKNGGNLLCIGPGPTALFQKELGLRLDGKAEEQSVHLSHDGWLANLKTQVQKVKSATGLHTFGRLYFENDVIGPWIPAGGWRKLGKGRIGAIFCNLGKRYITCRTALVRDYLHAFVRELFPCPLVEVSGSHCVDVTVMQKDGRLCVNLVNTAGPHDNANVYTFDEIPPIGPLEIRIRCARKPKSITQQPDGRKLPFSYSKGQAVVQLPTLPIHEVLVVE